MAALRGDGAASRAAIAEADEALRMVDTTPQVTSVDLELGRTFLLLGDPAAALARIRGTRWGGTNDPPLASIGALAAAELGDGAAVAEMASQAADAPNMRFPQAAERQLAATTAVIAGQWEAADPLYRQAIAAFRELELHLTAALLGLEYAAYLAARFADARAAGAAAEAWFAERGQRDIADRYRDAFAGTPAPPIAAAGATRDAMPIDAEQPA
jgi:hypothetical protein